MYHSGDEGNVDEKAAPCFVVVSPGDEKGLVYVSTKMKGETIWDTPLGKLEKMPVDDHVPAVIEAADPALADAHAIAATAHVVADDSDDSDDDGDLYWGKC